MSGGDGTMLVRDVMRVNVVTVTPRARVADAFRLTRERGVRHLPVVDDGALVGIVSDRDLKRAVPPSASGPAPEFASMTVEQLMTRAVITTGPACSVEDAGRVMVSEKISALPVTEAGRLVGIVTETDVVALLVRALGASEPSSRLEVPFKRGGSALAGIVRAVEDTGVSIASLMTLATGDGYHEAILRVGTIDPRRVVAALERAGYAVRGPAFSP
jgi:acetoin utilization protein AcuB